MGDNTVGLELVEDLKIKANLILEEYKMNVLEKGTSPTFMLAIGDPANIILEMVDSKDYDLVVLGTWAFCMMHKFYQYTT